MLKVATVCTEIWKDIPEYEGLYQVSNLGRVKSLNRIIKSKLIGSFQKQGTIIKPHKRGNYLKVSLSKNGEINQLSVHRLVAQTFVVNPEKKPCVNHKNGDKIDNKDTNLEWMSYSENTTHSYKNGFQKVQFGSKTSQAKLNELQVLQIRQLSKKITVTEIESKYNMTVSTISQIINRKLWKHN